MGLAAPRKRVKLSHDPNNTRWTRDTGGFGHKIMAAQGWQPGDILGAKNASHAEFHTAANASHIRVFVKDDNLGLGAKRGSGLGEGECTGLDAFQNLLGRLNGKEEDELTREQTSREDLKRAIYSDQRWGSVRFVKGGFLIGDKIQELIDNEEYRIRQHTSSPATAEAEVLESHSDRSSTEDVSQSVITKDKKRKKKRRKVEGYKSKSVGTDVENGSKSKNSTTLSQHNLPDGLFSQPKKSKKEQKRPEEVEVVNPSVNDERDVDQELKKKKKKKKKKRKEGAESEKIIDSNTTVSNRLISHSPSSISGSSTPQSLLSGRHAVRSRNIAQKRLAVLDTASLNQIFMIKQ